MKINNKYYYLNKLKYFPISFLSISLGLVGFALAWLKSEQIFKLSFVISKLFFNISVFTILTTLIIYTLKWIKYSDEVKKEFNHPIKINFYPIIAKFLFISSIFYLNSNLIISKYLCLVGIIIQFSFTIIIISMWIRQSKFEIHHINPTWFIPVVGNMLMPIAGVHLFPIELSWFFFSIGIFWWIILTTIIIYRMIFFHPIPDKLIPTFFILFAPPIIGFIALTKLIGISHIGNMLYYIGFFLFILISFQFSLFSKLKFHLSWWAYSFPIDALAIGTFLMYYETGFLFFKIAAWIIFIILNWLILFLFIKTIKAIKHRQICIEEKD